MKFETFQDEMDIVGRALTDTLMTRRQTYPEQRCQPHW